MTTTIDAPPNTGDLIHDMNHSTRVLVVDDFAPWRGYVRSVLIRQPQFDIVGEEANGVDAVRKSAELQPDLVLLDIALPQLNGIEAARRIRQCAPKAKILFLSENCDCDVARAALSAGGHGYLVKSDCVSGLLMAIRAVLKGEHFVAGFSEAPTVQNADARLSRFQ